ncbi:hypothetical protein BDN72DRAFT_820974 [Pluteus cervinus]|uniref:Uncharacterized protein n=1 Tax=Pluteus cervinus TaxID=181527 RepID=A0ACD3ASK5_9AGAR|nr:hypothetical protein BDN72DRAFT_820974 [Pluteus cervinus]
MQATLDTYSLKPFIRALTCLSRYGDELTLYATFESLSLSATNSSKSAYCRFKFDRQFFSKYTVKVPQTRQGTTAEDPSVSGQFFAKALLSILKHRTVEKAVDKCEFSVTEGNPDETVDDLESRLTLRLHCKHGVVKTHRLTLMTSISLLAPGALEGSNESCISIGPKAIKDMLEHFPLARGGKGDPQLVWTFGNSEVALRSIESSLELKGLSHLNTEITLSAEEFDVYDISSPLTIAFHLREFNATIAYADSMSLALELRFTDATAPLFVNVEGDHLESLFVLSTSQVHSQNLGDNTIANANNVDGEGSNLRTVRVKKPMKAAHRAEIPPKPHNSGPTSSSQSHFQGPPESNTPQDANTSLRQQEPLFLQSLSQESVMQAEIEPPAHNEHTESSQRLQLDALDTIDGAEIAPTQASISNFSNGFHPLFED